MKIKAPMLFFVGISLFGLNATSFAKDYYKWVDAQGSTHYTTTPPPKAKGIQNRGKIQTYGANRSVPRAATPDGTQPRTTEPATKQTSATHSEPTNVNAGRSASEPVAR